MARGITKAEQQEASRRLDQHHQAQPQEASPFCADCPFYASDLGDGPKHSTISGVVQADRWIVEHPKES